MPQDSAGKKPATRPEECPVCAGPLSAKPLGISSFKPLGIGDPENGGSRLWRCSGCGLILRDADYGNSAADTHFDYAPYVQPENLEHKRWQKTLLFASVASRLEQDLPGVPPGLVVDFGCSYGLLGEVFKARGWSVIGVDRAPRMLQYHREKGNFPVYRSLDVDDIPDGGVDAITMMDVLYYVEDPMELLRIAYRKLSAPGIVYVRVPHRNRFIRLAGAFQQLFGGDPLRKVECDHKTFWEPRTIRTAASRAGYAKVDIRRREIGFRYAWHRKALHWATQMISHITCGVIDLATVFHAELWKEPTSR